MDEYAMLYAVVKIITDKLTDEELAAMNICAQLGMNPTGRIGYEKAKALFDQGGTKMNSMTKDVLADIVNNRF